MAYYWVILIIMKIKKRRIHVEFTGGFTQDCPPRLKAGSLADMESSVLWLSGATVSDAWYRELWHNLGVLG